jgi:predicted transcriptional regulator
MSERSASPDFVGLTADIVSAYVSNNSVPTADLSALLKAVHSALTKTMVLDQGEGPEEVLSPAVPVKKSVSADYITCLEDGKKFKSLKRHLRTAFNMSPEQYRAKWGLPHDYPMVASNYAKARSELARTIGLGQQRRKVMTLAEAPAEPAVAKLERVAAKAAASSEASAPKKRRRATTAA